MAQQLNIQRYRAYTNSFEVTRVPSVVFYQYDVISPVPKPDNPRRRTEIIDKMQLTNTSIFRKRGMYDGKSLFYTSGYRVENTTIEVQLSQKDPIKYLVRLTNTAQIDSRVIHELMSPGGAAYQSKDRNTAAVNALQLVVRQAPNLRHGFPQHAKAFFSPDHHTELGGGLQGWRGYFQSVRPVLGKLLVNVDVTHAAVIKAGPVLAIAMEFCGFRTVQRLVDLPHSSHSEQRTQWHKLQRFLKGVLVKPDSKYGNWKKGRPIKDLEPEGGNYVFQTGSDTTTVQTYFQSKYGCNLRYPGLFGIKIGKDAVYPAELCFITPGQLYKRKLSDKQTRDFMKLANQRPQQRLDSIKSAVSGSRQLLDYEQSDILASAGMKISPEPLAINGVLLPVPQVEYFQGRRVTVAEGKWNVLGQKFWKPKLIQRLCILVCDSTIPSNDPTMTNFVMSLRRNLQKLGVHDISANVMWKLANINNLQDTLLKLQPPHSNPPPDFILVILPQFASELRKLIKFWSTCLSNIPTQCVRKGKYDTGNQVDQYCNNVALKMHAKHGGVNSVVRSPIAPILNGTLLIGCDVSHPGPGIKNKPSFASMVATVDGEAKYWTSKLSPQNPRQEIIEDISEMFQFVLQEFIEYHNKRPPKYIIIYRDGVSEGEYETVASHEYSKIKDVLASNSQTKNIPVVFIIVTKRHHTRFFPGHSQADRSGNCPPGFLVQDQIVHSAIPDYYLLSHSGIIGTSRPSHYIILRNDAKIPTQSLQALSFYLCHTYASATRSVSIPAPVYYADLLCGHGDYHVDPIGHLAANLDEDNSSSVSGGVFNLEEWKAAVREAGAHRSLYFL